MIKAALYDPRQDECWDRLLPRQTYQLQRAHHREQLTAMLSLAEFDLLLISLSDPDDQEQWHALSEATERAPLKPVVIVLPALAVDAIARAVRSGATDCIGFADIDRDLTSAIYRGLARSQSITRHIQAMEHCKYETEIDHLHQALSEELNNIFSLKDELKSTGQLLLQVLVNALEIADPYVRGHSQRVASLSKKIAEHMNQAYLLSRGVSNLEELEKAALLHDIGKLGIPDSILNKQRRLTEADWGLIRRHPQLGAEIVTNIGNLSAIAIDIRHHHERWDGQGYPDGLQGDGIPIKARIMSLADAFDAMVSPRVYREALGLAEAVDEVRRNSGRQFDPEVVGGLLWIVGEH